MLSIRQVKIRRMPGARTILVAAALIVAASAAGSRVLLQDLPAIAAALGPESDSGNPWTAM